MLRAYSKNISVAANNPIPFNIDKFDIRNNIGHIAGSNSITIRNSGYYEVNLDIAFTTAETPATQPVTIQLYADGVAIPDAVIMTNVTATEIVNASFNTIIGAKRGFPSQTVSLTVVPSNDITISSVAIGIDE